MKSTETYFKRLPLAGPFAYGANKTVIGDDPGDDQNPHPLNVEQGFSPEYASGRFVTREDMNAIGNMATQDDFYYMAGGVNGFDQVFAEKINGYPQGAVLEWLVGNNLFHVISLEDDNVYDFTGNEIASGLTKVKEGRVDGVHWAYLNFQEPDSTKTLIGKLPVQYGPRTCQLVMTFIAPKTGTLEFRGTYKTNPWVGSHNYSGTDPFMYLGCGLLVKEYPGSGTMSLPYLEDTSSGVVFQYDGWTPCFSYTRFGYCSGNSNPMQIVLFRPTLFNVTGGKKYCICAISGLVEGTTESSAGTLEGDLTKSIVYDADMGVYVV